MSQVRLSCRSCGHPLNGRVVRDEYCDGVCFEIRLENEIVLLHRL